MIAFFMVQNSLAQEYTYYYDIEKLQQENMQYLETINEIISDYPAFSYDYTYENGELSNVTVKGVDSDLDRKRLEVVIFDLKSNRNKMKADKNRVGVFYSPETPALPENGEENLREQIQRNLTYPEAPENWGVEGTVLVSFVVDENGEIPFITANANIETTQEFLVEDLKKEAIDAVKKTSGDWIPAKVEGEEVASLEVIPISFDFRKNPFIPALIR